MGDPRGRPVSIRPIWGIDSVRARPGALRSASLRTTRAANIATIVYTSSEDLHGSTVNLPVGSSVRRLTNQRRDRFDGTEGLENFIAMRYVGRNEPRVSDAEGDLLILDMQDGATA
jgi:hypothetical protein